MEGELASNEPEKQTAHWLELAGIPDNERVPGYHKDFLMHIFGKKGFMNARVEWLPPDDRVVWTIVDREGEQRSGGYREATCEKVH